MRTGTAAQTTLSRTFAIKERERRKTRAGAGGVDVHMLPATQRRGQTDAARDGGGPVLNKEAQGKCVVIPRW